MFEKLSIIVFNKKQNTTHAFSMSKLFLLLSLFCIISFFIFSCLYFYSLNNNKDYRKNTLELHGLQLDLDNLTTYLLNNDLITNEQLNKLNLIPKSIVFHLLGL